MLVPAISAKLEEEGIEVEGIEFWRGSSATPAKLEAMFHRGSEAYASFARLVPNK